MAAPVFLLKKIVAPFFLPVPFLVFLLLIGLVFLWFTRRQKTGKMLVTMAFILLALFSSGWVSDVLIRPLEQKYSPVTNFEAAKDIKWIVVLGGGSTATPGLPLSTYLAAASLFRLLEGVYIHNRLPETKLILTGVSRFDGITPMAEVMGDVAKEWGVESEDIVLETKATDTKDHPIYVKEIVGRDRFILVTSASHMPRAMALFRKHGMTAIPAPTDYMVKEREGGLSPGMFFPSAGSLEKAGRAIHEYLGMLWAKMRGQI
ncbi:MAG: envelope biogenesis factor ElyC [Deltaproteobacteria bacterium]|nr:envelope biogenesis factor ElyC [Deltaproteobacteria bacterium]